jgi:hypothetical protein
LRLSLRLVPTFNRPEELVEPLSSKKLLLAIIPFICGIFGAFDTPQLGIRRISQEKYDDNDQENNNSNEKNGSGHKRPPFGERETNSGRSKLTNHLHN